MKINRAIISVSDKTGIVELAQELAEAGIELISTGGTAKAIRDSGIMVKDISQVTGFPEIMDGRVKTLHPLVHGGLLARRDHPEDMKSVEDLSIPLIDLVIVNLYPFVEVTRNESVSLDVAIENIDIGGPTMLRAAAKNHAYVTVVTDPADYSRVLDQIKATGEVTAETRATLAVKVFHHTALYDAAVDTYLSKKIMEEERLHLHYMDGQVLRYGENSHQSAVFYRDPDSSESSVAHGEILNGKAMSYNNYIDANAALEAVKDMPAGKPAVAVIKHTNPCGLATGNTVTEALERAWDGDPMSAFGGVIATNWTVDMDFANFLKGDSVTHTSWAIKNGEVFGEEIPKGGKFVEIVIAPEFDEDAIAFLKSKSKTIRLVKISPTVTQDKYMTRSITGGALRQERDLKLMEKFEVVTQKGFDDRQQALAEFTVLACKHTKSNAIILAREYAAGCFQIVGMGAGQPNRVDSLRKLSVTKARENLEIEFKQKGLEGDFESYCRQEIGQMVMASEAFFPLDDTVREAARFGIRFIVQPGGSIKDELSIKACDELGVAMAMIGLRHFNH